MRKQRRPAKGAERQMQAPGKGLAGFVLKLYVLYIGMCDRPFRNCPNPEPHKKDVFILPYFCPVAGLQAHKYSGLEFFLQNILTGLGQIIKSDFS